MAPTQDTSVPSPGHYDARHSQRVSGAAAATAQLGYVVEADVLIAVNDDVRGAKNMEADSKMSRTWLLESEYEPRY